MSSPIARFSTLVLVLSLSLLPSPLDARQKPTPKHALLMIGPVAVTPRSFAPPSETCLIRSVQTLHIEAAALTPHPHELIVEAQIGNPCGAVLRRLHTIHAVALPRPPKPRRKGRSPHGKARCATLEIPTAFTWDGRDDHGQALPTGSYRLRLFAQLRRVLPAPPHPHENGHGLRHGSGSRPGHHPKPRPRSILIATARRSGGRILLEDAAPPADTTPPLLALVNPLPASTIADPRPLLRLSFSDTESPIATESFSLSLDGIDRSPDCQLLSTEALCLVTSPLADALHLVSASVADSAANVSQISTWFIVDATAPVLTLEPPDGAALSTASPFLAVTFDDPGSGIDPESLQIHIDGTDWTDRFLIDEASARHQVPASAPLAEGSHVLLVTLADRVGNQIQSQSTFSTPAPDLVAPQVALFYPTEGSTLTTAIIAVSGQVRDDRALATAELVVNDDEIHALSLVLGRFVQSVALLPGTNQILLRATDGSGNETLLQRVVFVDTNLIPPTTHENDGFACGEVLDAVTRAPLQGATVTIDGVDGAVRSDGRGRFLFPLLPKAALGRERFTLSCVHEGHAPRAQDLIITPGRHAHVGSILLQPLDPVTITIGPEGGELLSSDGRARLLVPAGALPAPVELRATFLPSAETLPGPLPPTSAYTAAVDLRPDGLQFQAPVTLQLANLHDLAPGSPVPVGCFDPDRRIWIPEANGQVTNDGRWMECTIGHFSAYDLNFPLYRGIYPKADVKDDRSQVERQSSKNLGSCKTSKVSFKSGSLQLWHRLVGTTLFGQSSRLELAYHSEHADPKSFVDLNVQLVPDEVPDEELGAEANVGLHFAGFSMHRDVTVTRETRALRGNLPSELLIPGSPNGEGWSIPVLSTGFHDYEAVIGYSTVSPIGETETFGGYPTKPILNVLGEPATMPVAHWSTHKGEVTVVNEMESPFGRGWSLVGLSRLILPRRPGEAVLLKDGSGDLLRFSPTKSLNVLAGTGRAGDSGAGGPAALAELDTPWHVAQGPDGSLYIADRGNDRICRITPDGLLEPFCGDPGGSPDDGVLATEAYLKQPMAVAVDREGTVYLSDATYRVRAIGADGRIRTIAGERDHFGFGGDGGPARSAWIGRVQDLACDRHGNVYLADTDNGRIRRIDPAGRIDTIAGKGGGGPMLMGAPAPADSPVLRDAGDPAPFGFESGVPALEANLIIPGAIWVDGDGRVFICDRGTHLLKRVDPQGLLHVVAGMGYEGSLADGVPATEACLEGLQDVTGDEAGNLYLSLFHSRYARVRRIDPEGLIHTMAGNADVDGPRGIAKLLDGRLLVVDERGHRLRVVMPDMTAPYRSVADPASLLRPLPDGHWQREFRNGTTVTFDMAGLQTEIADRHGNRSLFTYEESSGGEGGESRLSTITDPAGGVTRFAYVDGRIRSIESPAGARTLFTVNDEGCLTTIEDPDGTPMRYAYDGRGLVTSKTDGRGRITRYTFDDYGRITATERAGEREDFSVDARQGELFDIDPFTTGQLSAPESIVTTVRDGLGHSRSYRLDPMGAPLRMWDEAGFDTSWERNAQSLPTRISQPNGRISTMAWSDRGQLLSIHELADDSRIVISYHPIWNEPVTLTDALGHVTHLDYDDGGNLVAVTDALGNTTRLEHDGRGLVTATVDALGHRRTFEYDSMGNLIRISDARGFQTTFQRDAAGNLSQVTDALGNTTHFEHCLMNRLMTVTDALGHVTRFAYTPDACPSCGSEDQITSITDPKGNVTRFDYDAFGRLLTSTDALGHVSTRSYDLAGHLNEVTDALGTSLRVAHDPRGLLTERIRPDGVKSIFAYDAVGNLVSATAAANTAAELSSLMEHDLLGRVIRSTAAAGTPDAASTRFSHDKNGNLLTRTDAKGAVWSWDHDALGRVVAERDPLNRERRLVYNARSELVDAIDARGQRVHHIYDANGWLAQVEYFDATASKVGEVLITRDDLGRPVEIRDGRTDLRQTFDALGRLTLREYVNLGRSIAYGYDENGNRASALINGTRPLVYVHDELDRITKISAPEGDTTFRYDAVGKRQAVTFPNGMQRSYAYDELYRLTELSDARAGGGSLGFFRYDHDILGNPTRQEDEEGVSTYAYDRRSRLTRADYPDGTWEAFAYDAVGNRTSLTTPQGTKTSVYDIADQLLSDGERSYAYDGNGSQISSTLLATDETTHFAFNERNRLSHVSFPDGTSNAMDYYPLSSLRRSLTDKAGKTTRFLWDAGNVVEELADDNAHEAWYLEGPGLDEHLARIADGTTQFYLADPLNTVRKVVDATGNVLNRYTYKAFGSVRMAQESVANPYRFTGRRWEPDTGLHYYRARYFGSSTGRFSRPDPIAVGETQFGYCENNPQRFIDPSGLEIRVFIEPAFPALGHDLNHTFVMSSEYPTLRAEYETSLSTFKPDGVRPYPEQLIEKKKRETYSQALGNPKYKSYPVAIPDGIDERVAFINIRNNLHSYFQEGPYIPLIMDCIVATDMAIRAEGLIPPALSHGRTASGIDVDQWLRDTIDRIFPDPFGGNYEIIKEIKTKVFLEENRTLIGKMFGCWKKR